MATDVPTPALKEIRDCEYSVFISYSNADDDAYSGWVSDFKDELDRVLPPRARVQNLPPLYFGREMPAVNGSLADWLHDAVAASFAMVIVVHENYARSAWCLKELEYFCQLYGDRGFRERLFIVAMSEAAMQFIEASDGWKTYVPYRDQVWLPFFQNDRRDDPVRIYLDKGGGRAAPSTVFQDCLSPLVKKLAEKIGNSAKAPVARLPAAGPAFAVPVPPGPATNAPTPVGAAAALAPAAAAQGGVLLGAAPAELDAEVAAFCARLKAAGVAADALPRDALYGDFSDFDAADRLVLPFHQGALLMPMLPGGHLAMQRDAWLARKPAGSLSWLDLTDVPTARAAQGDAAAFLAALVPKADSRSALLARLAAPPAAVPLAAPALAGDAVRIYIESNQNELLLWRSLGEQIRKKWERLIAGRKIAPPLELRARGLPIDDLESGITLDDADGVVLFWGKKERSSLIPQINKVEARLRGSDLAPCIVAYLQPPQPVRDTPVPSNFWQVLRFDAKPGDAAEADGDIDVAPGDTAELDRFLLDILSRSNRRRLAAVPARASGG